MGPCAYKPPPTYSAPVIVPQLCPPRLAPSPVIAPQLDVFIIKQSDTNKQLSNYSYYMEVLLNSFHFEWSHTRVSSTDFKVRTTLYSIINSTTLKYCSIAFILNGRTLGFHPPTLKLEPPCTA